MNKRHALREDLVSAWKSVIEGHYDQQNIDSEASLQIHFAAALLTVFNGRKRRIFVEPTVKVLQPSIHKKPDLVICNQRQIIGLVELKYKPRGRASYSKDLNTLRQLSENRLQFDVANERYLGPRKPPKPYSLAHDAVLCWAAVYSGKRVSSPDFLEAESRGDFLALHAIASSERVAKVLTSNDHQTNA
jgi:hypothetical protein